MREFKRGGGRVKENKKEAVARLQQLLKDNYDNKEYRVDVIYERLTSNMETSLFTVNK